MPSRCCTPPCAPTALCADVSLERGWPEPATACHAAFDNATSRPCLWAGPRLGCTAAANASNSSCTPLLVPRGTTASSTSLPHVLFIMTDQQASWTVGGYHRHYTRTSRPDGLAVDGRDSYGAAADFDGVLTSDEVPVPTPHLDGLMAGGAFFSNFVVSAPWCVPSRAAFFTSRLPERARHPSDRYGVPLHDAEQSFYGGRCLPPATRTIGHAMREAGFATAYVGKYHLLGGEIGSRNASVACLKAQMGGDDPCCPYQAHTAGTAGFDDTRHMFNRKHVKTLVDVDEWGGTPPSVSAYDADTGRCEGSGVRWVDVEPSLPHLRASVDVPCSSGAEHYATTAMARWGAAKLRAAVEEPAASRRPLFLVLSLLDPHPPQKLLPPYDDAFGGTPAAGIIPASASDPAPFIVSKRTYEPLGPLLWSEYAQRRRWYMGMCSLLDEAVGTLTAEAASLGVAETTLTLFTTDHGELLGAHGGNEKGVMYDEVFRGTPQRPRRASSTARPPFARPHPRPPHSHPAIGDRRSHEPCSALAARQCRSSCIGRRGCCQAPSWSIRPPPWTFGRPSLG